MLIAATAGRDGRKILIFGLSMENVERLLNDQPIHKHLNGEGDSVAVPGLEEWDVYILGPEDTERFLAQMGPPDEGGTP